MINKYYLATILLGIVFGLIILMATGCATMREIYLDDGQSVLISAPTSMTITVTPEKNFIIRADPYVLGENLIVE